jgi:hypothetical protein
MRYVSCAVLLAAVCGCGTMRRSPNPAPVGCGAAVRGQKSSAAQNRGMAIHAGLGRRLVDSASGAPPVLWDSVIDNLETLGGPSSTVPWPE